MNDKEKLITEIARVRLVMEEAERKGEQFRVAMIAYRIKEAEKWIDWQSRRGMEKSLRELEYVK